MFRSSTILKDLVQSLAKVIFLLKHSVKLRRCILCGDVAACREMACVLFVAQTDGLHNKQRSGAIGWGTALQAGRSRVRFPMVSLEFSIEIILPSELWPWGWLSL